MKIIDFFKGLKWVAKIPQIKKLIEDAKKALDDKNLTEEEAKLLVEDLYALLK